MKTQSMHHNSPREWMVHHLDWKSSQQTGFKEASDWCLDGSSRSSRQHSCSRNQQCCSCVVTTAIHSRSPVFTATQKLSAGSLDGLDVQCLRCVWLGCQPRKGQPLLMELKVPNQPFASSIGWGHIPEDVNNGKIIRC